MLQTSGSALHPLAPFSAVVSLAPGPGHHRQLLEGNRLHRWPSGRPLEQLHTSGHPSDCPLERLHLPDHTPARALVLLRPHAFHLRSPALPLSSPQAVRLRSPVLPLSFNFQATCLLLVYLPVYLPGYPLASTCLLAHLIQ